MTEITLLVGERQAGESKKAVLACNDFLRMGAGRTLAELHRKYSDTQQGTAPTRSQNTLEGWSSRFKWADRAVAYDAAREAQKNAEEREALRTGLAQAHERVNKLKDLADFLEGQIHETDPGNPHLYSNVWVLDVKVVDRAPEYIYRFNAPLIAQYRGVLDDLAKETGGRVQKNELSGPNGEPIKTEDVNDTRARLLAELQATVAEDAPSPTS